MADLQQTKFLPLFGLTTVRYKCSYAHMQLSDLCTAPSALLLSGMTYITLFHIVWPNICDYANTAGRPFRRDALDIMTMGNEAKKYMESFLLLWFI
jgi:flagellar biosynthesis protein FliP